MTHNHVDLFARVREQESDRLKEFLAMDGGALDWQGIALNTGFARPGMAYGVIAGLRRRGKLIALLLPEYGTYVYPVWQFRSQCGGDRIDEEILRVWNMLDVSPLAKLSFMLSPNSRCHTKRPIDVLRDPARGSATIQLIHQAARHFCQKRAS